MRYIDVVQVIQGERQSGRTTALMQQIHEFILFTGARPSDVLVVVPAHNWIHWWTRMWQGTYPGVPVPVLMSIGSGVRARGRRFGLLAIEDLDTLEDGLYDDRLPTFFYALESIDPQILATSARIPMNWKNYTTITTIDSKMRDKLRSIRTRRRLQEEFGVAALLAKMIVDSGDNDLIEAVLNHSITPGQAVDLLHHEEQRPHRNH